MNKNEFIELTSDKTKLSKKDCLNCLNAITELLSELLKRGERVRISGFGKFETRIYQERQTINPQTKETMTVCQKMVPVFKSAKSFKNKIK